jgi:hypothetical protein
MVGWMGELGGGGAALCPLPYLQIDALLEN